MTFCCDGILCHGILVFLIISVCGIRSGCSAIEHGEADSWAAANERFIQLSSLNIVSGMGNLSLVSDDSVEMPASLSTSFILEPFRTFDHLFWHRFDG